MTDTLPAARAADAKSRPARVHADAETMVIRMGPGRDWTAWAVGALAAVLSICSTAYYVQQNLILAYQDSFSHLEISRRVVSGLSPGIAQLGGVWLPLPQLMQSMFSWNWTLYRTGLAGSVVCMAAYVASSVYLYRIVRIFSGKQKWPAVAGAMVFIANVNVLYHQSTTMDELPFYAFTLAAIFYLVRWGQNKRPTDLLAGSAASLLAMLCRYEGWYLAGVFLICVVIMARKLGYSWSDTRGLALVNLVFGLLISAAAWLLYNYMIFGNALNFQNGPYSSQAQMAERHGDVYVGDWVLSSRAYGTAVVSNLGYAVIAAAVAGLILFLVKERFSARSLPILALITLLPFFVYTLEAGQEPIGLPQVDGGLINYRYGLLAILPAAILIGYLLSRIPKPTAKPVAVVTALALLGANGYVFARHQVVLATEARSDQQAQQLQVEAGDFLQNHTSGLILLDIVQNERVGFDVVDRTVYDGTKGPDGNEWTKALADPQAYDIHVIVMRLPGNGLGVDNVYFALNDTKQLKAYHEVYSNPSYAIYED